MRLPDSVAEVQASPPGPEIGAFFDLDGTLVAGFTGVLMTQDTFRRREIGARDRPDHDVAGLFVAVAEDIAGVVRRAFPRCRHHAR